MRAHVERELAAVSARIPELKLVVLATGDGRYLAGWFAQNRNGARISAIVSSLLAICETAGKELNGGRCTSAIVTADELNIVAIRLNALDRQLVLATAFTPDLMLGAAVRYSGDIGTKLLAAIQQSAKATT
ncbi:MAG TPA: hypothetical protein VF132_04755 [Rudaea sp.]